MIENFYAKRKLFRAIGTRYNKTARNFPAGIHFAVAAISFNLSRGIKQGTRVCLFKEYLPTVPRPWYLV